MNHVMGCGRHEREGDVRMMGHAVAALRSVRRAVWSRRCKRARERWKATMGNGGKWPRSVRQNADENHPSFGRPNRGAPRRPQTTRPRRKYVWEPPPQGAQIEIPHYLDCPLDADLAPAASRSPHPATALSSLSPSILIIPFPMPLPSTPAPPPATCTTALPPCSHSPLCPPPTPRPRPS